jgi:hypothetical protein
MFMDERDTNETHRAILETLKRQAAYPFEGINEKLERAYENICNLDIEIQRFFQKSDYPVIPQNDSKIALKAIRYHRDRPIPPRFSVLSGEIIHHLRSVLDHLAWEFSTVEWRRDHPAGIEFPVFEKRPSNKDELSRYGRKVKGIINPDVLELIEQLQPYNSPDPLNEPLLALHKMDITDKHHSLVICDSTGVVELPLEVVPPHLRDAGLPVVDLLIALTSQIKQYGRSSPQVSFREFGQRPNQLVIPCLSELLHCVVSVVNRFSEITQYRS